MQPKEGENSSKHEGESTGPNIPKIDVDLAQQHSEPDP